MREATSTQAESQPVAAGVPAIKTHEASKHVRRYLRRSKEPLYVCPTCGTQIFTEIGAKRHAERHTESAKRFQCGQCSKNFLLQHEYTRHPCMTKGKVFKCQECLAEFKSQQGLQLHESSHSQKVVTCKECGQQFDSSYKLRYHYEKVHESPIKKSCRFCCKDFCTRAARKTHEAICKHNDRPNPVLHKCHQCSKVFKSKWNLARHTSTHSDTTH
ncbi:PREDICTED: oocyte zinc finger protein XlCOF26-like [Branchiostoma belcheri]|uniref:Oocyte zinc finger protein XlCOF26-like n=1 Tax=Branchiostoma belcheri TaxID=7741 RepID=A0A6P5ASB9_BRABE|nr:PREDICTED: oocyte zinc finger protein XlCOF26-like [Branchiostoma belcheri]